MCILLLFINHILWASKFYLIFPLLFSFLFCHILCSLDYFFEYSYLTNYYLLFQLFSMLKVPYFISIYFLIIIYSATIFEIKDQK